MRKLISSQWTGFYRYVFPALWIGGFGAGTIGMWVSGPAPEMEAMKWQFLLFWIIGSAFIIWFTRRLKVVWLEQDRLVVSGHGGEFTVPFSEIDEVSETRFWNPKMINVHLKRTINDTDKVVFLAPMAFQLPFTDHPRVKELKEMVKNSNG